MKRITLFLFLLTAPLCAEIDGNKLSLNDCLKIALDTNPVSKAAERGVAIEYANMGMTKASYYPDLHLTTGARRWQTHAFVPKSIKNTIPIGNEYGPFNDYYYDLHSNWTLYDFGKRSSNYCAAKAHACAAQQESKKVNQDIVLSVSVAFYSVIANLEMLSVAEKNLERSQHHMELAKEKQVVGAAPLADVYRAQVEVADTRQALAAAKGRVRTSYGNLATAMGLPAQTTLNVDEIKDELPPPEHYDLDRALEESVRLRPEIHAADETINALNHGVSHAKSLQYPTISAKGVYGYRDQKITETTEEFLFGVSVHLPLFTGYEITNTIRRAEHLFCQKVAEREQLALTIQQEVWTSHSNLIEAYEQIQTATIQVNDAQESRRLAEERYDAGSGTITDLLDSQTALAHAEGTLVQAKWHYHTAITVFLRSQGKLL